MKLTVTTSDAYLHCIPVFISLWNKYARQNESESINVEIVGYKKPDIELPEDFSFKSLGEQNGNNKNFGTDLKKYFSEQEDQYIMWCMEDSWWNAPLDVSMIIRLRQVIETDKRIGRISLTAQNLNQYMEDYAIIDELKFIATPQKSEYRLSTMPAIWNKDFLLRYLKEDMNPWEFECQDKVEDEFYNIALEDRDSSPWKYVEGVRRFDNKKMNFEGIDLAIISEMAGKGYLNGITWTH